MNGGRLVIPLPVLEQQRRASDPGVSAWVSANAGSGKTHVLTQRVLRLLLDGVAPSSLLCLTFTKTAAANMAAKVFETLAKWTGLDDHELTAAIEAFGAPRPDAAGLAFARRLFARAIETPGGLKIQTIHAFCERLLHLFPFEANVAAGFRVADDREAKLLLDQARAEAFADAFRTPGGEARIARVGRDAGGEAFDELVDETLRKRATLEAIGDARAYEAALRRALGLAGSETSVTICNLIVSRRSLWPDWARELEAGTTNDGKLAASLRRAIAADHVAASAAAYLEVFFTDEGRGKPRGGEANRIVTQALAKRAPDLPLQLADEQQRVLTLRDRLCSAEALERSVALYAIAESALTRYAALKGARGMLDYEDLIARTRALLERADAAWVLYKLDAAIEHILVDEAQDTSPAQWAILVKLCEEFLAGAGARDTRRTLFVVGDEKQSIFSFQGAAPHKFAEMLRKLEGDHRKAELPFLSTQFLMSFRSAKTILDGVDRVFAEPSAWRGLTEEAKAPSEHQALRADMPGLIELWPVIAGVKPPERKDWRTPLDEVGADEPAVTSARRIAGVIRSWVAPGSPERIVDIEAGGTRPIRPGDVMILVRSRGPFFEAMIRALKENGVATAGADRLQLGESLAVMDLVAAGHAALTPEDDLTLATVLKSPLIGLDDDDLLRIAPGRAGALIDALDEASDQRFVAARERLGTWRRRARALTPFAFYATLLGAEGGRKALLERLGPEAADAIDEFMALALAHEREQAPSLTAFLAEIAASDAPVKRDMEARSDGVRVMTVHGAKGLEAPIVFLPDTCSSAFGGKPARLIDLGDAEAETEASAPFVWAARKGEDSAAIAKARERRREADAGEHRRLLYVAMTRAAQRLIVAGHHGARGPGDDNWLSLIAAGLADALHPAPAPWDPSDTIQSFGATPAAASKVDAPIAAPPFAEPAWLRRPAPLEATPTGLRPSRAATPVLRDDASYARRQAGALVHALLQRLPDVAPERRGEVAERFLAAQGPELDAKMRAELAERALTTLARPELAPLLAPGSRAEVAIGGALLRPGGAMLPILGRIDRLAVAPEAVYLADYKNSARPFGANPPAYVAQLALYRAALAPLYPERPIRAYLVWLRGSEIVEVSALELDVALATLLAQS
jgi:ATP-dependent helicase/nuclease subunit A